ncbi:hypothetical protein [Leptospira sp. GIMC2001]|uniref:hypothetical protein n=1 Tax=Leptospira sp. GIMC2001 TaxID=1513297 RepID=UPI0023490B2E|nr:hypothetical protein [Leptospira sp. GIMC2001]WCL48367.1 hypothetical protein O4O04_13765 [Leptospira sp. GIMC2001]
MKIAYKKIYKQMIRSYVFFLLIIVLLPSACNPAKGLAERAFDDEKNGNIQQALYGYELALKEKPDYFLAHKRMGIILSRIPESWGVAIWHLEKALSLQPKDEEIRVELFYLFLSTDRQDEINKILTFWNTNGQEETSKEFESLFFCETKNFKLKQYSEIVNASSKIREFWKARCNERASNN